MRPADGEASAPDFEKDLEKDPHEAKIPEFEGLNVKNEVCMAFHEKSVPDTCPEACNCRQLPAELVGTWHGSAGDSTCQACA